VTILRITQFADLRVTQGGSFTYNTFWQFYIQHSLDILRVTQCGRFTYNPVRQFYV